MFELFYEQVQINYRKERKDKEELRAKMLKEHKDDQLANIKLDLDRCYLTPRQQYDRMLKEIGETQSTRDHLFEIYSYGCDRLVDLREVFWVYLLTGEPSYTFKLRRLFDFVDLNKNEKLDKVEFNKLVISVIHSIDKAFFIYYACKNFNILTEYFYKTVSDDNNEVNYKQVLKFFEHNGMLIKFMRNFEGVHFERASREKSHMIQLQEEKKFYKHQNLKKMKEVIEQESNSNDLFAPAKRKSNKRWGEDDDESEFTTSRPESRVKTPKGRERVARVPQPAQFKVESIYNNNRNNWANENNFSEPVFKPYRNEGFKFVDMNLFRYRKLNEPEVDINRYTNTRDFENTTMDETEPDNEIKNKTFGKNYLEEYYRMIFKNQEEIDEKTLKDTFKKYDLDNGEKATKQHKKTKPKGAELYDTNLYPRMHLNTIHQEMNYVDTTRRNLERDMAYNNDIINMDKVIFRKNKMNKRRQEPESSSDEDENRWQYIKREDIELLYKWFLRLCEDNSDFALVETIKKDFGEEPEMRLKKYDAENYYYIYCVKMNFDKYQKENEKKYFSFYDILQILFGNYNKSFDVIWGWVKHIYIMREGFEINWNREKYLEHYFYYIWRKANKSETKYWKPELVQDEEKKNTLTFAQFEKHCHILIKSLNVEVDWWRDRICELTNSVEGYIDVNMFLMILENNRAYQPGYYENLLKKFENLDND